MYCKFVSPLATKSFTKDVNVVGLVIIGSFVHAIAA